MSVRNDYRHTVFASYIGYITQAIVNIFAPLLFVTFQTSFQIPLSQVGLLVTINFCVQIVVDFLSARFIPIFGYRKCIMAAHIFAAAGLIGLGTLPFILSPFAGLVIAVVFYAVGGGLTEVLISPIVEACPMDGKSAAMSLLHSFYCWGCVLVITVSTLFFKIFGIVNWPIISCVWAMIPIFNIFYFSKVPMRSLEENVESVSMKELFSSSLFWILALLMVCSGASELAMSQWASAFTESALHLDKTLGDLFGPCLFAILMGVARIFHSKIAEKTNLYRYLTGCGLLCVVSYLLAALSPAAIGSLFGCGLCGLSVAAMWPGVFSLAAKEYPEGGTAMFALLALFGDLGCAAGPTLVGLISSLSGDSLKTGFLFGIIFPFLMILGLFLLGKVKSVARK